MSQQISIGDDLAQEIRWLKQDCSMVRNAVILLEQEKDNLRQAVRKLKLENVRMKDKMKRLQSQVKTLGGTNDHADSEEEDVDYDDIGRDFLLIGGAADPLGIRYEATIKDDQGVEHKSVERYYWYKMAEHFGDKAAQEKIQSAPNTTKAEEVMKEIKGFDEKKWDEVKVSIWEAGQTLKLEQVKWVANLLLETGNSYLAVSHQDKYLGTGWRKNREESNKPIFWDGKNAGGRFLMKYRKQLNKSHAYAGPNEKEEATRRATELRRFVWRRIDTSRSGRGGAVGGGRGGRGGYGSRGGGHAAGGAFGAFNH